MHRRLRAGGAAAAGLVLALASYVPPAAADASGFGFTDGPSVGAGARDGGPAGAPKRGGARSAERCDYVRLDAEMSEATDRMARDGWWSARGEGPGAWFRKICSTADGPSSATLVWIPRPADPGQLAKQALDRVPLPQPAMQMNPSAGGGALTNVETWLWIDPSQWQPVRASASAGGVTVTTTATPERVVFEMGNGDTVTCGGPGTPYDPGRPAAGQSTDCSYTYRRSSAHQPGGRYLVTSRVFYRVGWSASGIAAGGALGPVSQTSSVRLRVAEIQALNK